MATSCFDKFEDGSFAPVCIFSNMVSMGFPALSKVKENLWPSLLQEWLLGVLAKAIILVFW